MKNNTIRLVLREKLEKIAASLPEELGKEFLQEAIVCGGAIASMLLNEKPNDYDVYFKHHGFAAKIANYYAVLHATLHNQKTATNHPLEPKVIVEDFTNIRGETKPRVRIMIKSAGYSEIGNNQEYEYFETQPEDSAAAYLRAVDISEQKKLPPFSPVFVSDNAISLSNKVQIIIRFSGDVDEIHDTFDFIHTMSSYDYATNTLKVPREALESLLSKSLVYEGSLYPLASMFRIRKFIARGWSITAGQMLKIAWHINELDMSNPEVLKDQLMGVDYAYMRQLIVMLQNAPTGTKIDSIYIAGLIDKIFD